MLSSIFKKSKQRMISRLPLRLQSLVKKMVVEEKLGVMEKDRNCSSLDAEVLAAKILAARTDHN